MLSKEGTRKLEHSSHQSASQTRSHWEKDIEGFYQGNWSFIRINKNVIKNKCTYPSNRNVLGSKKAPAAQQPLEVWCCFFFGFFCIKLLRRQKHCLCYHTYNYYTSAKLDWSVIFLSSWSGKRSPKSQKSSSNKVVLSLCCISRCCSISTSETRKIKEGVRHTEVINKYRSNTC